MRHRIIRTAVLLTAGALLLAGCSSSTSEGTKYNQQDSGRTSVINKTAADIIEMPDGFSNAATKCDHGNRIYVLFHGDSAYGNIFVVPNAPGCAQ